MNYKLKTKFFLREFYEIIHSNWTVYIITSPGISLCILHQRLSENSINFSKDLFDESELLKGWFVFKTECNLNITFDFQWLQLIDAIQTLFKIALIIMTPSQ